MNKLLKLKEWLTVPDAARYLSIRFGEEVTEADILRFALDGHLKLSVDFVNHATARCGKIIPFADAEIVELPNPFEKGVFQSVKNGSYLGDGRVFSFCKDIRSLEGIWDLSMLGAERLDVEHKYHSLTGGPAVELITLCGPLVCHPDGTWAEIMDNFAENKHIDKSTRKSPRNNPENYYPAGALPSDAVFVVRMGALQDLEVLTSEPEPAMERPTGQRERDTLLVIIAALAELNGIDVTRPSKAALAIEKATIDKRARISARAIENHLKRIPDALERKLAED